MDGDKIFKVLQSYNRRHNIPDLHSFRIETRDGSAFVECRGDEIFIENYRVDENGNEVFIQWAGTVIAAANRLEMLGADLLTIED